MLQVAVDNIWIPDEVQFVEWVESLSAHVAVEAGRLTVRVVDEKESQSLNMQFRGKDKPTNVLSFPSQVPDYAEQDYLGDLIICAAVVAREAQQQNKSPDAHWAHMLVHGVLHLHGYDHIEDDDAQEMEALETKILIGMGFPAPYAA